MKRQNLNLNLQYETKENELLKSVNMHLIFINDNQGDNNNFNYIIIQKI